MDRRNFLISLVLLAISPSAGAGMVRVRSGRRGGRSGGFVVPPVAGETPDEEPATPTYSPPARDRANSFAGERIPTLLQRIQIRLFDLGYYRGPCDGADNLDYRDALDHYRIRNNIPLGRPLNQAELQVLLGPGG